METTNIYKLEKLGNFWHILRLHYVGWFIFKRKVWLSKFPYYWYKEDALIEFNKKLKQ